MASRPSLKTSPKAAFHPAFGVRPMPVSALTSTNRLPAVREHLQTP
jgi:hypothetical protein